MDRHTRQVPGSDDAGKVRRRLTEGGRPKRLSEAEWAEAEAAYLGGESGASVAARHGIARHTLYARIGPRGKRALRREEMRAGLAAAQASGAEPKAPWHEAMALAIVNGLTGLIENVIAASGLREAALARADGLAGVRKIFSEEVWAQARIDYEVGFFTAAMLVERYGMTENAIRSRITREGWRKRVEEAPDPLLAPPDPAQVNADGTSAWERHAHAAQRAPEGEWATWLFQGGRGAGKTRAGAEWLARRAEETPRGRFALVGPTLHDVREVMIEGPSGLLNLPGRERPKWESSRRRLQWKNGAVAFAFSAEEPERLRGPQFDAAWADEFCAWARAADALSNLRLALRRGERPQLVVTTTPRPLAILRKLRDEPSCAITQAGSAANAAHLAPTFLSGLEAIYGGTRLAKQELEGVLLDGDGALWTQATLDEARGHAPDKFDKVVVGVDPPAGMDGSACGIVVAGRRAGRGYVLADYSVAGLTPNGWALRVAEAAREFGAQAIIAEGNQGGEMVRSVLRTAGAPCRVDIVHARIGKRARAEPVSALYEQGRVTHCGTFAELETAMLELGIGEAREGLDRADALVWALTHLLVLRPPLPPGITDLWAVRREVI